MNEKEVRNLLVLTGNDKKIIKHQVLQEFAKSDSILNNV